MTIKVIPQSQLRAAEEERPQAAKGNIFHRMILPQSVEWREEVDVATQGIELDQAELRDLYESARKLLPGCNNITMPLEDVARLLSPRVTWFEGRILLQMLTHTRSGVLSMIPDDPQPSGSDRPLCEDPRLLTVWFRP